MGMRKPEAGIYRKEQISQGDDDFHVLSDRSINFKATKVIFSVALKGHGNEADFMCYQTDPLTSKLLKSFLA